MLGFNRLTLDGAVDARSQDSIRQGDSKHREWLNLPGNNVCFECNEHLDLAEAWVSVTYAISLCEDCAGLHRGLGTHLSKVKSLTLDFWEDEELQRLTQGGNARCAGIIGKSAGGAGVDVRPDLDELRRRCALPQLLALREQLGTEHEALQDNSNATDSLAMALTERPGYFHTGTGFGYEGGMSEELPKECKLRGMLTRLLKPVASKCPQRSTHTCILTQPTGNLFQCAEAGDADGIEWWLSEGGASVDDEDSLGWTALHYAARFNQPKVCSLLLRSAKSSRCSVDVPEKHGCNWTPLQWAAQLGHVECAYVLLEFGAAPDGVGFGKPPVRLAAYANQKEMLELLLSFGANPLQWAPESLAAELRKNYSWRLRRRAFLIRDKAAISKLQGPEQATVAAFQRPTIFWGVATFL